MGSPLTSIQKAYKIKNIMLPMHGEVLEELYLLPNTTFYTWKPVIISTPLYTHIIHTLRRLTFIQVLVCGTFARLQCGVETLYLPSRALTSWKL